MLQPLLQPAARAANDRLRGASPILLPAPPLFDFDFVGRPSLQHPGLPPIAFTRASAATRVNAAGLIETVPSDAPRFDHDPMTGARLGLLIEEARTNYLLNSLAPATQTTESLGTGTYTLWVAGTGSAEVAANTATMTGAGTATEGSPVTFTVTGAGTLDVTVTGSVSAFQLENGVFPTSLIVTAGAAAARAADLAAIAAVAPWFNAAEGTLYAEASILGYNATAGHSILSITDGTNTERIEAAFVRVAGSDPKPVLSFNSSSAGSAVIVTSDVAAMNEIIRIAGAYRSGDNAASSRGRPPEMSSLSIMPSGLNVARCGRNFGAGVLNGRIRRLAYFPSRLPNSSLEYLTKLGT